MLEIKVRKEAEYVVIETENIIAVLHGIRHLFLTVDDEEYGYLIEGHGYTNVDDFLDHIECEFDDEEELRYMGIAKYLWRIGIAALY